jgi:ATP-dependent Clp protease ATP-binding subunit ClpC
MTSNLGSELIVGNRQRIGFDGDGDDEPAAIGEGLRGELMRRLAEHFRPEFLNRIDEVIVFRRLEVAQLREITSLMLERSRRRLHAQNITVEFTPSAVDWLARHGYEPEYGARPMRRLIQREVDNVLSRMLLDNELSPGQRVVVDAAEDQLRFLHEALATSG